ncbi:hypothetical protein [Methylibium sp.]|uniref:hypothetical protein n=1 Tax=Methylibium sp. TaxID=2067992 RepID=UPI003D1481C6
MSPALARLLRALRAIAGTPIALLILFEEWGWQPLSRALGRLARWAPVARLEDRLRQVPPPLALALFLAPALGLLPVKLLALWLVHAGHAALGLALIVAAKLLGTALLGRLFVLTEPQLRHYRWLARALDAWSAYKQHVKAWWRSTAAWRAIERIGQGWRRRWRRWLATRSD